MNIPELIQQLSPDAVVQLFVLDLTGIGGTDVLRFHAGTNSVRQSVYWQGHEYIPWPIQAEGFDLTVRGTLPRPKIHLAVITNTLIPYISDFDDLLGAKVVLKKTFARYLDGQPGADPNQHYPDETYYVQRKEQDDGTIATFELASAMDLQGVAAPKRQITIEYCPWQYRKGDCPYTGTNYFDVNDNPVNQAGQDVCSHTPRGCMVRFGANNPLPFGGFVAAHVYKT